MRLAFWLWFPLLSLAGTTLRALRPLPRRQQARTLGPVSPRAAAPKLPRPALRLEVEVLDTPEGVVVRLRGEAGVLEAAALEAAMLRLVARRPARVTFDLS